MANRLGTVPLVRRIAYLETYLKGIKHGRSKEALEAALVDKKEEIELEKSIALGRGQASRAKSSGAAYLLRYCYRLSRDLGLISVGDSKNLLSDSGAYFLDSGKPERVRLLTETYSEAYPHLYVLIGVLLRMDGLISLPFEKDSFDSKVETYGLGMSQVVFDSVRDMVAYMGLVNWRIGGTGEERIQYVYLTCRPQIESSGDYLARIAASGRWLFFAENEVLRDGFREVLWESYLNLAEGVPGSPVFYSGVRDEVCYLLRITDDQFDREVSDMMIGDEALKVYGSEGFLPYRSDSAGMWKSLPPKNVWGDYIVYLRIERN